MYIVQDKDDNITMSSNNDSVGMPWEKVIDKEVKSSDKEDLWKVQSIGPQYIQIKEGSVRKDVDTIG